MALTAEVRTLIEERVRLGYTLNPLHARALLEELQNAEKKIEEIESVDILEKAEETHRGLDEARARSEGDD